MCNLYSVTKGQTAIRKAFKAMTDTTGNLPPLPGIFPDQMAPVVRNGAGGRELTMMRWGLSPKTESSKEGDDAALKQSTTDGTVLPQ